MGGRLNGVVYQNNYSVLYWVFSASVYTVLSVGSFKIVAIPVPGGSSVSELGLFVGVNIFSCSVSVYDLLTSSRVLNTVCIFLSW